MKDYIKLMRPHHYIKNLLIFLPIFFGGQFNNTKILFDVTLCFLSFCLLSSCIYIINDIKDLQKDKNHPTKKNRPIASGKISQNHAAIFSVLLFFISGLISVFGKFNTYTVLILVTYFLNNIAYSVFGMKNVPLVDIASIVFGFCLRVFAGSFAANISISDWLYLVIISGSFYLAIGKRLKEKIQMENKNGSKRAVLEKYPIEFLSKSMYMCMTLTIVFYTFWCIDDSVSLYLNGKLIWTVPLVIMIALKYTMDIENADEGDPTTIILRDKVLLFLGGILCLIMFFAIYL